MRLIFEQFIVSSIVLVKICLSQQLSDNLNDYQNHRQNEDRIVSSSDNSGNNNYVNRGTATFNFEEYEDDASYEGTLMETIPGKAGKDFPAYTSIPETSFTCKGRNTGYFADPEAECQVFHICVGGGQKISFLCPNGSIFNQKVSVCDWWYDVHCASSSDALETNDIHKNHAVYDQPLEDYQYPHFIVETDSYYDLNLASSGGNRNPKYEKESTNSSDIVKKNNSQGIRKKKSNRPDSH